MPTLHLSLPVSDLDEARRFYAETLGCEVGRSRAGFTDVWFFGLQLTLQDDPDHVLAQQGSRHFGVTLECAELADLLDRLEWEPSITWVQTRTVDFEGTPQEQRKAKIADPSGNVIELKAYVDPATAFDDALGAEDLRPQKDAVDADPTTATLYTWAGGDDAFARLIDAFYDRVEHDASLSPLFPGGVSREHREHVVAWWSEVFGGPARYSAEFGGYRNMVDKHRDLDISPDQRRRFVELMSMAADDAGLPDDPEFRSALLAYLEWGTRLAFANSKPDADVIAEAPVPRWGWGEAPPFEG